MTWPRSTERAGGAWQRWLRQPRRTLLRRVLFQVHLWSGVGVGVYVFLISVTGSVLVYRNELYVAAMPDPTFAVSTATPSDGAAPRVPLGFRAVSTLIDLHDNLLAGRAGRTVNGLGAIAVLVLATTGLLIWWRGASRWRQALTVRRHVGWKRFVWDLHSALGFWSLLFVLVFGTSGVYLCFPDAFHALADRLEPPTATNAGGRVVDGALYWLAFLHFGRIDGIGLPCSGPGLCDQSVKALWALFGLAPATLFVTGATMWWNRVLRRRIERYRSAVSRVTVASRHASRN